MTVLKKSNLHNEAELITKTESNDSKFKYKDQSFSYSLIRDTVFLDFQKFAEENGVDLTYQNFVAYCENNQASVKKILEKFYDRRKRRSLYKMQKSKH